LTYRLADPYGNWNDGPSWTTRQVNLTPSGRELRFGLSRDWSVWPTRETGMWLALGAEHVLQGGHVAEKSPETIFKLSGGARF
jgi:hypothetical protein